MWDRVRLITGQNAGTTSYRGPMAEELNQHFADISTDSTYQSLFQKATVNEAKQEFIEFSEYFTFNLLDKLKPTASGLDGLPSPCLVYTFSSSLDCRSYQSHFSSVLQLINCPSAVET